MPLPKAGSPWSPFGQGQLVGAVRSAQADHIVGKVETRPSFDKIAAALRRQAGELVSSAEGAEYLGLKIELSEGARLRAVSDLRQEAELIGDAYRIISKLVHLEQSVRAMADAA